MRGSKCSANWSTSRPLLPCSHSLPSDDLACLLHSASALQLFLSQWNFGFYMVITAIRLYLSVAQNPAALRLWAEGICQTRGRGALNAHAPPSWALLCRARVDASASTRKYVASASEPQTCPHSGMEDTHCTQIKEWAHSVCCHPEMSPLTTKQTTKSHSDADLLAAPRRPTLGQEFQKWADSRNLSDWTSSLLLSDLTLQKMESVGCRGRTDKTLIVPLGNGMCFNTGRCCTGTQSRSNRAPSEGFTKSIQVKNVLEERSFCSNLHEIRLKTLQSTLAISVNHFSYHEAHTVEGKVGRLRDFISSFCGAYLRS